ncbi:hypothetical protein J2S28_005214 [Rhizobium sp. SLBN-94]|nr:hypothetical protein [Rhizobium sp. SLBN-94]MDP9857370.1 hypothetical protein [Agrobacterium tumefaciens]
MQTASWIAVSEIERGSFRYSAAGGVSKAREKLRLHERLTKAEGSFWNGSGLRFPRSSFMRRWGENRGDECARAVASLDKTITQQMFISDDDRVAADADLLRKRSA